MTELFPYLAFEKAKDAIAYYAEQFGMTKEQAAEATMHAEFEVLGVKILCSDSFGRVENINNGISLLIDFDVNNQDDSDRVQQFYDEIKDHDSLDIEMPLKEQFWGGKMGAFTDKYGVRWMLHGQDYTKLN